MVAPRPESAFAAGWYSCAEYAIAIAAEGVAFGLTTCVPLCTKYECMPCYKPYFSTHGHE